METKIAGYWELKKEELLLRYPSITNADLNYCHGKEKEMIEMLAAKPGRSIQEIRDIIIAL
jgi:hypothetical protein